MGAPIKQSVCPIHLATHTPTIPRTKEKPAQSGAHKQPSWAQLRGKDEVAMSWVGVRLAWVTQGSEHLPWDLAGGVAWDEGWCHWELGTGLLGTGGAGTLPIQTFQLPLPGGECPGQVATVPSWGPRGSSHLTR